MTRDLLSFFRTEYALGNEIRIQMHDYKSIYLCKCIQVGILDIQLH